LLQSGRSFAFINDEYRLCYLVSRTNQKTKSNKGISRHSYGLQLKTASTREWRSLFDRKKMTHLKSPLRLPFLERVNDKNFAT
jgi:hypothetical protein